MGRVAGGACGRREGGREGSVWACRTGSSKQAGRQASKQQQQQQQQQQQKRNRTENEQGLRGRDESGND